MASFASGRDEASRDGRVPAVGTGDIAMNAGRNLRVAIIGAGIGGMAAACALRQRGCDVVIYERATELGEVGAGLQLGPNAFKVFRALGIDTPVRANAFAPMRRVVLNWDDASLRSVRPMNGDDIERFGGPFLTAHRAELHRVLAAALGSTPIHLGMTCVSVGTRGDFGVARFADGTEIEADVIVGADGVRSAVRENLFGRDQPRFTNSMCWRCIVPISEAPARVGQGGAFALSPTDHISWYGPTGQVICYPLGDGQRLNIFAGHVAEGWVEESWSSPSSREELLAAYAGWNEALLGMFAKVEDCFKWGIFDREPRTAWTIGRITLLGDAAHPTMPNLAQGANMAIEDGYVLARALAAHADINVALARYVAERQPRTRDITLQSRENFRRTLLWPPAPAIDRDWIYEFDATREPSDGVGA